jgi:nucleoid-associated protein YejK
MSELNHYEYAKEGLKKGQQVFRAVIVEGLVKEMEALQETPRAEYWRNRATELEQALKQIRVRIGKVLREDNENS